MYLAPNESVRVETQWLSENAGPDGVEGQIQSSDPMLVTVDDHGDGTADLKAGDTPGTVTITATFSDGTNTWTGELQVTVVEDRENRLELVAA